jgi:hypothetical protein
MRPLQILQSGSSHVWNVVSSASDFRLCMDLPNSLQVLLTTRLLLLAASDEQMSLLGLASLDVHELVEFEHAPLAAAPAFAALVEDGRPWVMYTRLPLPIAALVSLSTSFPPTRHAFLERNTRVIVL